MFTLIFDLPIIFLINDFPLKIVKKKKKMPVVMSHSPKRCIEITILLLFDIYAWKTTLKLIANENHWIFVRLTN